MTELTLDKRFAGLPRAFSRRDWLVELGPPVLAFLGVTLVLWVVTRAEGVPFWNSQTWARWDSYQYGTIVNHGYYVFRCPAKLTDWCGDAGWFPGYPAALALFVDLGVPVFTIGVVVSWLFALGTLILLWRYLLTRSESPVRYVALIFAAFDLGGIYMRAVFPMSMTAFFLLLCLVMLDRRRWVWAGVAGGLAAFCYATATAIVPVVAIWALAAPDGEKPARRVLRAVVSTGAAVVGFLAALLVFGFKTGRTNAYFLIQAKYEHGLHLPWLQLQPLINDAFRSSASRLVAIEGIEATLTAAVCLSLVVAVVIRTLRGRIDRWELVLVLFVLAFWLFPLTQAKVSYWRSDSLLLPAALLVARMRPWLAVSITTAVVAIFPFLAYFFFTNLLE